MSAATLMAALSWIIDQSVMERFISSAPYAFQAGVEDTAVAAVEIMKEEMQKPKSGRTYMRAEGGYGSPWTRMHVASAPGEAPAVDYGDLIASIDIMPLVGQVGVQIVVGDEAGSWMEFGNKWLAPRPFFHEAIDEAENYMAEHIGRHLDAVISARGLPYSVPTDFNRI